MTTTTTATTNVHHPPLPTFNPERVRDALEKCYLTKEQFGWCPAGDVDPEYDNGNGRPSFAMWWEDRPNHNPDGVKKFLLPSPRVGGGDDVGPSSSDDAAASSLRHPQSPAASAAPSSSASQSAAAASPRLYNYLRREALRTQGSRPDATRGGLEGRSAAAALLPSSSSAEEKKEENVTKKVTQTPCVVGLPGWRSHVPTGNGLVRWTDGVIDFLQESTEGGNGGAVGLAPGELAPMYSSFSVDKVFRWRPPNKKKKRGGGGGNKNNKGQRRASVDEILSAAEGRRAAIETRAAAAAAAAAARALEGKDDEEEASSSSRAAATAGFAKAKAAASAVKASSPFREVQRGGGGGSADDDDEKKPSSPATAGDATSRIIMDLDGGLRDGGKSTATGGAHFFAMSPSGGSGGDCADNALNTADGRAVGTAINNSNSSSSKNNFGNGSPTVPRPFRFPPGTKIIRPKEEHHHQKQQQQDDAGVELSASTTAFAAAEAAAAAFAAAADENASSSSPPPRDEVEFDKNASSSSSPSSPQQQQLNHRPVERERDEAAVPDTQSAASSNSVRFVYGAPKTVYYKRGT